MFKICETNEKREKKTGAKYMTMISVLRSGKTQRTLDLLVSCIIYRKDFQLFSPMYQITDIHIHSTSLIMY